MLITGQDGAPVELDELDAAGLLDVLGDNKRVARAADRDRMRLVNQWCVVHPARHDPDGIATFDPSGLPGVLHQDESLGGQGCPAVAAFAPEPVAAALGIGKVAVKQLFADTLDLHHRLPRCWKRLERLEIDAWKARRVAQLTHSLSKAAAADVDAALAPVLPSCSYAAIDRAVAAAIAVHHPELLEQKAKQGKDAWDVTLSHPRPTDFAGTSWLEATGDTLAFTAFDDRLCQIAADLAANGDTDPLGARKAKAMGILAGQPLEGPEADLLDLAEAADAETATPVVEPSSALVEPVEAPTPGARGRSRRRGPRTHLYLHYRLSDLLGLGADDDLIAGRVEGRGHVLEATLQDWIAASDVVITPVLDVDDDSGTSTVPQRLDDDLLEAITSWTGRPDARVTPVLDLNRAWAVDGHDAPEAMREQVIQLHEHCVHPWCQRPSRRADLDHTIEYVPLDEGGPPGQTNPHNLAPLCRRHHRCKTTGRWRYRRLPDGSHRWTTPHGRQYLVTRTGTTELPPN